MRLAGLGLGMNPKSALRLSFCVFVLASTAACKRSDPQKPYWDLKHSFGEPLEKIAGYAPYIDDSARATGYLSELTTYARNKVAAAARDAFESFDRRPPSKDDVDPLSAAASPDLRAVALACKAKIGFSPTERARRDLEGIAKCKEALGKLDAQLKKWQAEAVALGIPEDVVPRVLVAPAAPPPGSDLAALRRLVEPGPAEKKWEAVRADPNATRESLRAASDDAEKEAAAGAKDVPPDVRELFDARALAAKGRKLAMLQAERMSELDCEALTKLKPNEACPSKEACRALREIESSPDTPAVYLAKVTALARQCAPLAALPSPAPSPTASGVH